MNTFNSLLDAPEHLLAAHDRLRTSGFPVVSLVNAHVALDARVWLCRWARARGRLVIVAPENTPDAALAAYRARIPPSYLPITQHATGAGHPVLLINGDFRQALTSSASLAAANPEIPVALATGIANIVETLLDPETPKELVVTALQGLTPVEDTSRQVLTTVAEARQVQPFLRGACEGLLYYMLEARPETRGRFSTNFRLPNTTGPRSHEVDLVCVDARLVIEIDGLEHNTQQRKTMDSKKQKDLEGQGYRVRRFSNEQVIDNPVGVWRLIAEHFDGAGRDEEMKS
jgi:very-short-patch-repair endonuclease